METKRKKHVVYSLCLVMVTSFLFTGCGKKDDPAPANNAKISMKFTLSVTGADQNDQIDFAVSAGNHDASQYGAPVWKINGTTQGNENVLLLDKGDFTGATKTYVIETVKPFNFGSLKVGYSNHDGAAITMSYKAEVNGAVETNVQNLVIAAGQSQIKNFTYQPK
jgi:hypothetical protein